MTNPIQVGDTVNWTYVDIRGRGINMRNRKGKVVAINNEILTVEYRKKNYYVLMSNVTREGDKNPLTKMFDDMSKSLEGE